MSLFDTSKRGNLVPRILVADDNSNIQKMVALAFEEHGIEVVAVGNGEAAVRRMPELIPDVVLADVFMPVRNGYEVCEFVKKDSRFAKIPVILLVGAFDPLDEAEARRVGADGVLKKPFVPPDPLIAMVTAALAKLPKPPKAEVEVPVIEIPKPAPPPQIIEEFPEPAEGEAVYAFGTGRRSLEDEEAVEVSGPNRAQVGGKIAAKTAIEPVVESEEERFSGTQADWRRREEVDSASVPSFSAGLVDEPAQAAQDSAAPVLEADAEIAERGRADSYVAETDVADESATTEEVAQHAGDTLVDANEAGPSAPSETVRTEPDTGTDSRTPRKHWMDLMAPVLARRVGWGTEPASESANAESGGASGESRPAVEAESAPAISEPVALSSSETSANEEREDRSASGREEGPHEDASRGSSGADMIDAASGYPTSDSHDESVFADAAVEAQSTAEAESHNGVNAISAEDDDRAVVDSQSEASRANETSTADDNRVVEEQTFAPLARIEEMVPLITHEASHSDASAFSPEPAPTSHAEPEFAPSAHAGSGYVHGEAEHVPASGSFAVPEAENSSAAAPAASPSVDELVAKVLEKLGPQLQEFLAKGVVRPLVEDLLRNPDEKKK